MPKAPTTKKGSAAEQAPAAVAHKRVLVEVRKNRTRIRNHYYSRGTFEVLEADALVVAKANPDAINIVGAA